MSEEIVPVRTYVGVFVALLVLLGLTVAAAQIEHGTLNLVVGLSIACAKAGLIVLYFMHVRHSPTVIRLVAFAGVMWFTILMLFTMVDVMTRS